MLRTGCDMDEARKVTECTGCGADIYEGEKVYVVGIDDIYCSDCVTEDVAHYDNEEEHFADLEHDERAVRTDDTT